MHRGILFSHIPKTAGTSFRVGLDDFFNVDNVLKDYGPESKMTTEIIREFIYRNRDLESFRTNIGSWSVLCSHFHDTALGLRGYRHLFPEASLATFVRDPLKRILSEYYHFRDKYGFNGSFEDFYSREASKNRQCNSIGYAPLVCFDFVGITEKYDESLFLFNSIFQTSVKKKMVNTKNSKTPEAKLSWEDIKKICRYNIDDIILYNQSLMIFYLQSRSSIPVSCFDRYDYYITTKNGLTTGWAIDYTSCRPVELCLKYKSGKISYASACLFLEDFVDNRKHISGYCGFEIEPSYDQHGNQDNFIELSIVNGPKIKF